MKIVGLLAVLFGGALFYLVGWKCYKLSDFWQEISNFTHLDIAGYTHGTPVTPKPCPKFGFPSLGGGS